MGRNRFIGGVSWCIALLLWGWSLLISAQTVPDKVDVRLLIDVSGSMKRNDPGDLRQPAVDLLVRLLPDGSKAGVWVFDEWVRPLAAHQSVDESWREAARAGAASISSAGLYTHIGAALERAAMPEGDGFARNIILLTDGMVDIDRDPLVNRQERQRVLNEVLPQLQQREIRIHTIALSAHADQELMQKLAASTGGTASVVASAEELIKAFLAAFDAAVPATTLPLQSEDENDINRFLVDSSVEEFTALIFRRDAQQQTRLVEPGGKTYHYGEPGDEVQWHRTEDYDLITVAQPLEGEWQALARVEPESRVAVVSNLGLRVKPFPVNLFQGEQPELRFVLQESGETLTDPAFLALLDNQVSLAYATGTEDFSPQWSYRFPTGEVPAGGIYHVDLPKLERLGHYRLTLQVDGKSFRREFRHAFQLTHPFSAKLEEILDDQGQVVHQLQVHYHTNHILPEQTQVVASVVGPNRRKIIRPLQFSESGYWQTPLSMAMAGEYQVNVDVSGEDVDGERFEYRLAPLVLTLDPDAMFEVQTPQKKSETAPSGAAQTQDASPMIEPPAMPETVAPETDSSKAWLWLSLAAANLALVAGGAWYWLRRRKRSSESDSDAQELPAAGDESEEAAELRAEDLEPAMDEFEMDEVEPEESVDESVHDEPAIAAAQDEAFEVPTIPDDDDYGLDDIETQQDELSDAQDLSDEDEDPDDLDAAIADLIGELDDDEDEDAAPPQVGRTG